MFFNPSGNDGLNVWIEMAVERENPLTVVWFNRQLNGADVARNTKSFRPGNHGSSTLFGTPLPPCWRLAR